MVPIDFDIIGTILGKSSASFMPDKYSVYPHTVSTSISPLLFVQPGSVPSLRCILDELLGHLQRDDKLMLRASVLGAVNEQD